MPKTDIKLYSKNTSGQKQTTTISYVNNDVSSDVLKDLAQSLNALTTNSYEKTDRINTLNCDTETIKMHRELTITNAIRGQTATITFNKTSEESVTPAVFSYQDNAVTLVATTAGTSDDPTKAKFTLSIPSNSSYIYIGIVEKEQFYSEFTLTQAQ